MIYLANTLMIMGAITLLISGLGILRLPTFLMRIHPAAKSTTLGIILFFAGVGIIYPHWAPRLAVAVILFMFTGPVSASALSRTALTDEEKEQFYPKAAPAEEPSEEVAPATESEEQK